MARVEFNPHKLTCKHTEKRAADCDIANRCKCEVNVTTCAHCLSMDFSSEYPESIQKTIKFYLEDFDDKGKWIEVSNYLDINTIDSEFDEDSSVNVAFMKKNDTNSEIDDEEVFYLHKSNIFKLNILYILD